jgi:hypothetical protein
VREAENYIVLSRKLKRAASRNRYKFSIIKLHTSPLSLAKESTKIKSRTVRKRGEKSAEITPGVKDWRTF